MPPMRLMTIEKKKPVICVLMCLSTKIVFLHELLSAANIGTQLCLPIVDIYVVVRAPCNDADKQKSSFFFFFFLLLASPDVGAKI